MTEAGNSNANESLTGLAYVQAYLTLFAAHWFGARRFDRFGRQDGFDPEDVQAYCAQRAEYLRRNFTRSRQVLPAAEAQTSGGVAAEAAEQPAEGAETRDTAAGVGDLGDAAAEEGAETSQTGQGRDGQAEVQIVTSRQAFPLFVMWQSFAICVLYACFALKKYVEDKMTGVDPWLAGLDSWSRGTTDLRWSGPHCEDCRPELWRWITYQWTHIGVVHVLTNTVMLILLGVPLEGFEGHSRMCFLFNAGVIAGALCFFLNEAHGYVVGCSAGIYALLGVHMADLVMNWKERHFRRLTLIVLVCILSVDTLTWAIAQDLADADYSYSAALGGILAGVILESLSGRNFFVTRKEQLLMLMLSSFGCVLVILALAWLSWNEAPINIWEAASGENGYCWVRQFFNQTLDPTGYQCVRCGTQDCIEQWSQQPNLLPVRVSACASQGWFYDGR